MTTFHFLRPEWLWGLVPVLLLFLWQWRHQKVANPWARVCQPQLLTTLLMSTKMARPWPLFGLAAFWLLSCLALAGPTWQYRLQPVFDPPIARVIVFDASPAMLATDLSPSRLQRAKYKALDILKQQSDGSIGLVAFSRSAYVVSPLTRDGQTVTDLLNSLSPDIMPAAGENIAAGLAQAAQLIQQAQHPRGEVFLITASTPDAAAYEAATALRQQGISVSVLGVGTAAGGPLKNHQKTLMRDADGGILISQLHPQALQRLARDGGGDYLTITPDNRDVEQLLAHASISAPASKDAAAGETRLWQDQGVWLIWIALPLVLLGFRRGWLERLIS